MAQRRDRPAQPRGGRSFEIRLGDGRTVALPEQQRRGPLTGTCCFCGESLDDSAVRSISVSAHWLEGSQERSQDWGAHRTCLAERLHERLRGVGPFFGEN
jgi:hypothetical protein